MSEFRQFIHGKAGISESDPTLSNATLESRSVTKGTVLLEPGTQSSNTYFVESGLLRLYHA